jgi:AAA domain
MLELDLFSISKSSVTAPAGCGKTQLIADSLKAYSGLKPVLVLTHTNAGKGVLEARLDSAAVPKSSFRVFTIDSWAIRVISKFPARSGSNDQMLRLENSNRDYPAVREAALRLLSSGDIDDILAASYSRLVVDEYQDCTLPQHAIIGAIANVLPTCVLGDPLQAIFGFREPTVHWDKHVRATFPELGVLNTPWRWKRVGADGLGNWLLAIRAPLLAGEPIDLRHAPPEVVYIPLPNDAAGAHLKRMEAARIKAPNKDGTVLIIGDSVSPSSQRQFASLTPGASTVEAVDLRDLTAFARTFDPAHEDSIKHLVNFAGELMTNLGGQELQKRLASLKTGRARNSPNKIEAAFLTYAEMPSFETAANALEELEDCAGVRVYRHEVLHVLKAALRAASVGDNNFYEATVLARERNRHLGRRTNRVAVGSTLLLKGLEADVAVVLNPSVMDARHLYVALSRGARKLVICSPTPVLTPAVA